MHVLWSNFSLNWMTLFVPMVSPWCSKSRHLFQEILSVLPSHFPQGFDVILSLTLCRYSRDITSPRRNVRTRLYFTSESHIHSVLNLLIHGQLLSVSWLGAMSMLLLIEAFPSWRDIDVMHRLPACSVLWTFLSSLKKPLIIVIGSFSTTRFWSREIIHSSI